MKPLPAEGSVIERKPLGASALPTVLPQPNAPYSSSNRKSQVAQIQRVYPWLLMASTLVAAFFCYLYMTKPVFLPAPEPTVLNPGTISTPGVPASTSAGNTIGPASDRLPGDPMVANRPTSTDPRNAALRKSGGDGIYEETNLRVQHVLTAEAPGGDVNRISLNVPVLYKSRNLRWNQQDVAKARDLLTRLTDYQERSRALRAEGITLLDAWNRLIDRSIPAAGLRADSPSLTTNQGESDEATPAALDTADSIRIQSSGK